MAGRRWPGSSSASTAIHVGRSSSRPFAPFSADLRRKAVPVVRRQLRRLASNLGRQQRGAVVDPRPAVPTGHKGEDRSLPSTIGLRRGRDPRDREVRAWHRVVGEVREAIIDAHHSLGRKHQPLKDRTQASVFHLPLHRHNAVTDHDPDGVRIDPERPMDHVFSDLAGDLRVVAEEDLQ
jgi:hypothetical protein